MSRTPADKPTATRKKKRVSITKFDSDIAILENAPMAGAWLERLRSMFNVESMSRGLEAAQLGKVRKLVIEQAHHGGKSERRYASRLLIFRSSARSPGNESSRRCRRRPSMRLSAG